MNTKKICLLGAFAVGKTSLVKQYIHSTFAVHYISTLGVKISKKQVCTTGQTLELVLWELEGKDNFNELHTSYLRGSMGFILVADGTHKETLDIALSLRNLAVDIVGDIPHLLLLNKADAVPLWEVTDTHIAQIEALGVPVIKTSAKTGLAVEEAFTRLVKAMI